jgi:hypothetical protein
MMEVRSHVHFEPPQICCTNFQFPSLTMSSLCLKNSFAKNNKKNKYKIGNVISQDRKKQFQSIKKQTQHAHAANLRYQV